MAATAFRRTECCKVVTLRRLELVQGNECNGDGGALQRGGGFTVDDASHQTPGAFRDP